MRSPTRSAVFGHGMCVVKLRCIVHDQEAARLEIDMDHAPRRPLRAYGHPPGRAERDQCNGKPRPNLVEMVVMRVDAVPAVRIPVEADALNGARQCPPRGATRPRSRRVATPDAESSLKWPVSRGTSTSRSSIVPADRAIHFVTQGGEPRVAVTRSTKPGT